MALKEVGVRYTAEGAAPFVQAVTQGNTAIAQFGGAAESAGGKFSAFGEIATGALRRVGEMAVNAAMQGGRALLDFGKDSIKVAGDYEGTLNRFSAVTGSAITDAGFTVDQFSQKFLKLGADTQYSAQQAADAGVELAKGGVPIEQIMGDATDATLALAAAGELGLAPAAQIVAKQLGVWGDQGVTATNVANLLAQAANASTVDVDELALGLANVGGTAKVAGVSFKDTVQTMALLSPGFSSAADAGTSLKTMLSRLIPKTKDQTGMMMKLGLYTKETGSVFYDSTGSFIGMEKAADLLKTATEDLSQEQKLLALDTIFGADAIRAAAILAEQGAGGFATMGDSMTKAGDASAQAAERNKGFNFALESLRGSLETVQIVLGTSLLPTLTSFVNTALIPGINAVLSFSTAMTGAASPLDYLAGSVGRLLANLGPIGTTMQNLINIFIRGQDTFANWTFLERSLAAVGGQLGQIGTSILAWVTTMAPQFAQAMGQFALGAAAWVLDSLPTLLANLGTMAQTLVAWTVQGALLFEQQMLAFGAQAVAWIGPQLPKLGDQLGLFFNRMVTWVVDSLPGWIAQLQLLGKAAIKWVEDALPGLGTNLGLMTGKLLGWIAQTALDVVPKLFVLAGTFLAWVVTDVLPELPTVLDKIGEAIVNFIIATGESVTPKLIELAVKFVSWINTDVLPALPGALDAIVSAITTWIVQTVGYVEKETRAIGAQLIEGMKQGILGAVSGLISTVTGALGEVIQAGKDFLGIHSPSTVFQELGSFAGQGFVVGFDSSTQDMIGAVTSGIGTAITTAVTTTQGSVFSAGQSVGMRLNAGLSSTSDAFSQQLNMLVSQATQAGAAIGSAISAGGNSRIQPPASPGQIFNSSSSITNNGPSVSYSPTYNSPAPPPALSFGALRALAGV